MDAGERSMLQFVVSGAVVEAAEADAAAGWILHPTRYEPTLSLRADGADPTAERKSPPRHSWECSQHPGFAFCPAVAAVAAAGVATSTADDEKDYPRVQATQTQLPITLEHIHELHCNLYTSCVGHSPRVDGSSTGCAFAPKAFAGMPGDGGGHDRCAESLVNL